MDGPQIVFVMDYIVSVPLNSCVEAPPANAIVFGDRASVKVIKVKRGLVNRPNLIEVVSIERES
jgi:hypothetical protein